MKRFSVWIVVWLCLALGVTQVGCSGGGDVTIGCVEGDNRPCDCPGGLHGQQSCNSRGQFWACVCAGADSGVTEDVARPSTDVVGGPDVFTTEPDVVSGGPDVQTVGPDVVNGRDVVSTVDVVTPTGCVLTPLGSAVGMGIARGSTTGRSDAHSPPIGCLDRANASPDALFAWTAPATGTYTFDTTGSAFDTVLTVRSFSCTGPSLGCSDDITAGMVTASRVSVALVAGQPVIVAIEGYDSASGDFVLNVALGSSGADAGADVPAPVDPCAGVSTRGRCATTTRVEYCEAATGTTPSLSGYDCAAGERCSLGADGYAQCSPIATCREGVVECLGATQIRRCTGGVWRTTSCPRECISTPIGDLCGADIATRIVTGSVAYDARRPNDPMRPTDWATTTFRATAQGFLVVSVRAEASGTVSWYDVTTTSLGTSDGGRFSIRVPTVATSSDRIVVIAAAGDALGNVTYVVADPGFATVAMQRTITPPPSPRMWGWSWSTSGFVAGSTLVITESMGSGAARIFDYLRYVNGYVEDVYGRRGLPMVAWLGIGTSWDCGKCMALAPIPLFGSSTAPPLWFFAQTWFDGGRSQAYWADAVTAHEFGHWVMNSFSAPPAEAGQHMVGGRVYPGMAWSEGFATWFSADVRGSPLYVDKQSDTLFWINLAAREYAPVESVGWERPRPANGLEQRIDENEVAAMMWSMRNSSASAAAAMYAALASPRMLGPTFARGYRRWWWSEIDAVGNPVGAVRTTEAAPYLADFLDAMVCSGFSRAAIDAATQPFAYYPYPSASPLCF